MTLRGTLDTVGLDELLGMLCAASKSGCVRMDGDRGQGRLWIKEGRVVSAEAARSPQAPLDEVLCDLLHYRTGSFSFADDKRVPAPDGQEEVGDVVGRARALLTEWCRLETIVPSLDHGLTLRGDLAEGQQVTIDAEQWPVLVAIGTGCTVGDLRGDLGVTELCALRMVRSLLEAGAVTLEAPGRMTGGLAAPSRRTGDGAGAGLGVRGRSTRDDTEDVRTSRAR
jgi:hypothetical protein